MISQVAISYDDVMKAEALELSKTSHIPLQEAHPEAAFSLHLTHSQLALVFNEDPSLKALTIDFLSGKNQHRRLYGGGKGQQLAKAIGLNKFKNPTVIDTTAGLGRDSFVLATLGCDVTLLERILPVYLLLEDALSRANQSDDETIVSIIKRMSLQHSDSKDYLLNLKENQFPDVIYIDPMFPPREKSAKVKKEMVMFHHLVGKDNDAEALICAALPRAKKRIVVKRPRLAECLHPKPAFQITGKSTRYDVYLPLASTVNGN